MISASARKYASLSASAAPSGSAVKNRRRIVVRSAAGRDGSQARAIAEVIASVTAAPTPAESTTA